MEDAQVVTLDEVKARWALSELMSERTSVHYRSSQLGDTYSKILAGSTFENLNSEDVERLLRAFEDARGKFLGHYLRNTSQFALRNWSKTELADVYAMRR
jgi:hypothetical protein